MGTLKGGPNTRRRRGDQRGAVYVEVVVCLVPVIVVFLCAVQLALIGGGRLVVTHAATRGARAAIVLLEDDPEQMRGAPRGDLAASGGAGEVGLRRVLAGASPVVPDGSSGGGARLQAIREAVYAPLAALAPPARVFALQGRTVTLRESVGGGSDALARFALGVLAYNRGAAVITLREARGSGEIVTQVEPRADVTVHVTYLQYCAVPIAARFMCHPAWDLAGYGRVLEDLQRLDPHRPAEAWRVMRRLKDRYPDSNRFEDIARELARAESPGLLLPLLLGGGRFRVLQAQATLPNQGAYYY